MLVQRLVLQVQGLVHVAFSHEQKVPEEHGSGRRTNQHFLVISFSPQASCLWTIEPSSRRNADFDDTLAEGPLQVAQEHVGVCVVGVRPRTLESTNDHWSVGLDELLVKHFDSGPAHLVHTIADAF